VPRFRLACPVCGGEDADIVKGRELEISSFDGHRAGEDTPGEDASGGSTSELDRA
jgi:hypothetical protein